MSPLHVLFYEHLLARARTGIAEAVALDCYGPVAVRHLLAAGLIYERGGKLWARAQEEVRC